MTGPFISIIVSLLLVGLPEVAVSQSKSVSADKFATPTALVTYVNQTPNADIERIRGTLNIRSSSNELPQIKKCHGWCKAEVLDLHSKLRRNDVVVKVSEGYENNTYFFFERLQPLTEDGWRLYGSIDWFSYGVPEQEIKERDGKSWFLIRGLGGKGTGVATYYEAWHNVDGTTPKVVLLYPYKGYAASGPYEPGYVSRIFKGEMEHFGSGDRSYNVKLNFSVTYEAVSDDQLQFSLFTKNQIGHFVWNAKKKVFDMEPKRSNMTEAELRDVYNFDTLNDEDFVKYSIRELSELGMHGSKDQKKWLAALLTKIEDSPRKKALQRALATRG